jgi:hypothetical protein
MNATNQSFRPALGTDPRRRARQMPEANSAEWRACPSRSENQARVPFTTRLVLRQSLTAGRDLTPSHALEASSLLP